MINLNSGLMFFILHHTTILIDVPHEALLNNTSTGWLAHNNDYYPWLDVDLGQLHNVTGVMIQAAHYSGKAMFPTVISVTYSDYGYYYKSLPDVRTLQSIVLIKYLCFILFLAVNLRHMRSMCIKIVTNYRFNHYNEQYHYFIPNLYNWSKFNSKYTLK